MKSLPTRNSGFSLIEMLIALAILGLLSYMLSQYVDLQGTKGKVLFSKVDEVSKMLVRIKSQAACYPTKLETLSKRSAADKSFCGADLRSQWEGPYLSGSVTYDTDGNMVMTEVAPNSIMKVGKVSGPPTQYYLEVSNIPFSVLEQAIATCNGGREVSGAPKKGNCTNGGADFVPGDKDSIGSFRMIFDKFD